MKRLLLLLPLLCGCPGSLDDPSRYRDPVCPDVERELLATRCGTSGCHGSGQDSQAGLDLRSPGVADRLLDRPSACGAGPLVDGTDPEASVLYGKTGPEPPCDLPMPLTGAMLTDFERGCLLAWIEDVAAAAP